MIPNTKRYILKTKHRWIGICSLCVHFGRWKVLSLKRENTIKSKFELPFSSIMAYFFFNFFSKWVFSNDLVSLFYAKKGSKKKVGPLVKSLLGKVISYNFFLDLFFWYSVVAFFFQFVNQFYGYLFFLL